MSRPRFLDLFSKAGGGAMGYHRAGFEVEGVDIEPQPNYPFKFHLADAFTFLAEHGHEYAAIGASPMCRDWTPLVSVAGETGTRWQLGKIEEMLFASGKPYVLENVMASPLKANIRLCGKMFGLRVKRHRKFKSNVPLVAPEHPESCRTTPTATSRRRERWEQGWDLSVTGDIGTYFGAEAMGIDWMTGNELSQAIPPAYTEYIGKFLMDAL